jgi:N-methylhydantoinase A/oxoprolinase/acetone carboxylase beta subunit
LVHGTTQATNAMLELHGARTGLITSRGHENHLVIGRVHVEVIAGRLSPGERLGAGDLRQAAHVLPS